MNDRDRLIAFFGYEIDGGRKSYLWQNRMYFSVPGGQGGKMLDESFAEFVIVPKTLITKRQREINRRFILGVSALYCYPLLHVLSSVTQHSLLLYRQQIPPRQFG